MGRINLELCRCGNNNTSGAASSCRDDDRKGHDHDTKIRLTITIRRASVSPFAGRRSNRRDGSVRSGWRCSTHTNTRDEGNDNGNRRACSSVTRPGSGGDALQKIERDARVEFWRSIRIRCGELSPPRERTHRKTSRGYMSHRRVLKPVIADHSKRTEAIMPIAVFLTRRHL